VPHKTATAPKASNPKQAFGIVLRRLRERQGWSQDSFAHHTGFHRNYIGQLERGEKSPSLSALFVLGKGCGVSPSQLLKLAEKLYSPD